MTAVPEKDRPCGLTDPGPESSRSFLFDISPNDVAHRGVNPSPGRGQNNSESFVGDELGGGGDAGAPAFLNQLATTKAAMGAGVGDRSITINAAFGARPRLFDTYYWGIPPPDIPGGKSIVLTAVQDRAE